jgi:hypothetical protein
MGHRTAKAAWFGVLLVGLAASPSRAAKWADSLFSESGHDFGPIPRGAKVKHQFVLTNRLKEPLTIVNVRASCGCTSGRASESVVAPGATAVVEAQMDTRSFVDRKETTLFVDLTTASGQEAEVRLGVSSTILSDVVLNPGSVDFGAVLKGQTPTRTLTIDRIGAPNWRVEKMVSASKVIDAQMVESARNGSLVSYTLTVSLKPDAPAGVVRDEIRVETNDPETASITLPVIVQIKGELSASPNPLSLGTANSSSAVHGRILIKASKPFTIQGVQGTGDGFKLLEPDRSAKAMHVVTVVYKPEDGATRGDLNKVFKLFTDLPGEPPLEVAATLHVDP